MTAAERAPGEWDPDDLDAANQSIDDAVAADASEARPDRPSITLEHDHAVVLDAAERAIIANPARGEVYQRSGVLARVLAAREKWKDPRALGVGDDAPVIGSAPVPWLRERCSSSAKWHRVAKGPNGPVLRQVDVPESIAVMLAARGSWSFPYLAGVVEAPTLLPDGELLTRPGHDPRSGLLYIPRGEFPPIPVRPTKSDAIQAMQFLADPFCDFQFLEDCDLSAVLAHVLTHVGRFGIAGPAPLFFHRASTPGSGKSLVAELVGIMGDGRVPRFRAYTKDTEEVRKAWFSLALAGVRFMGEDNIVGDYGDAVRAMAISQGVVSDRVLGGNKAEDSKSASLFGTTLCATGNNVRFRGDLGRRIILSDQDPKCERPQDRTGPEPGRAWKYQDVRHHVQSRWREFTAAALTVLRAHFLAGRPLHGGSKRGFNAWDDVVRSAIIWCGWDDPAGGCKRISDDGDADLSAIRTLAREWRDTFGHDPQTLAEVCKAAEQRAELSAAIDEISSKRKDQTVASALGYAMRAIKRRTVEVDGRPLCFEPDGKAHGKACWRLVDLRAPRTTVLKDEPQAPTPNAPAETFDDLSWGLR